MHADYGTRHKILDTNGFVQYIHGYIKKEHEEMMMTIGIDLGTTTTEAAVYMENKVITIPDPEGKVVMPSVVGIDEAGKFIVGEPARARYLMAPERTAIETKRQVGIKKNICLAGQDYHVSLVLSKLLEKVKANAELFLDETVEDAVISVPAYFDERQRQVIVSAGEQAGFQVKRIINEPTAAAMCYGLEHIEEESKILIYDFGGGTFDVTLLEMCEGVLEVLASSGDNQLGGKDFDECLVKHFRDKFEKENHISLKDQPYALARLKDAAEQCKIALSTQDRFTVNLPMLAQKKDVPLAFSETVTRKQFEKMILPLVERTHEPIDVVLEDGNVSEDEIDLILFVGGSTRVPLLAKDVEQYLGQAPTMEIDPDYSVSLGAAVQAAIIDKKLKGPDSLVVTDVNPYSLGVRCTNGFEDDIMSVIIPRNVTIPVSREDEFYTSADYVSEVWIEIYQGESRCVHDNHRLGRLRLSGIPSKRMGEEPILVSFSYNLNGMLKVNAKVKSTGKEAQMELMMTDENLGRMDVTNWKESPISTKYRSVIRRAERKNHPSEELSEMIYELKCAIINEDMVLADRMKAEIEGFNE